MSSVSLHEIARDLLADYKGILAADESSSTIKSKLESHGVEDTPENRKNYREMLFSTPGIEEYISGVIMYDETFRQKNSEGQSFVDYLSDRGIIPGIKVDKGKVESANFPGEYYTQGLDGLRHRFREYASLGAKFAKWRAAFYIGGGRPSASVIRANAVLLALYSEMAQESGIVPIVEPEIVADGEHGIDECEIATHTVLDIVFEELLRFKIDLTGILLKPNMILDGLDNGLQSSKQEIAERTLAVLRKTVPADVAGIVFLSGGQTTEQAVQNLCEIEKNKEKPWPVSFSYGRALQDDALEAWKGKDENIAKAQEIFLETAKRDSMARKAVC